MNREELAWAAGFFDGEGHCSYTKSTKKINFSVNQTDTYVLERFQSAVMGLGKIYKTKLKLNPKHNDIFVWRTSSFENTQAVIVMLWNFLSPIKKDDILRTLISNKNNMSNNYKYSKRVFSYTGKVISRSNAKVNGLLRYYTGNKCINGHISERWVKNKKCFGCQAEQNKNTKFHNM